MPGRIVSEVIEAVREAANLEEIVSEHVTLTPASVGSLKGLCPFHDEKTPSFNITPASGLWYCFGCGEGGDTIDFVQRIYNITFVEAVEMLAERTGIELRYEEGGRSAGPSITPGTRQRLLDANRVAELFFQEQLRSPEAAVGREFLAKRAFDPAAAAHFGVGYAPKSWDALLRHLRNRGFTDQEIIDVGLAIEGNRGPYDRFRGRLIWPIRDVTGATLGFGGRRLDDTEDVPKYLNTPETVLYKKSHVLYGLDLAKKDIAKSHQCVVMEGYTDVMAAHLAGITTAVASCGTAFGENHTKIVRRLLGTKADAASSVLLPNGSVRGGEVIFTFDGDDAGINAALRAFNEDQRFAAQSFIAVAPDRMDPCELRMAQGDEALKRLIESRQPLVEYVLLTRLRDYQLGTVEGRVAALRDIAPIVASIRDNALKQGYIGKLAGWTDTNQREVMRLVNRVNEAEPGPIPGAGAPRLEPTSDPIVILERQCLQIALRFPAVALSVGFDEIGPDAFSQPSLRAVYSALQAAGGVRRYQELTEEFTAKGTPNPADAALRAWAGEVKKELGSLFGPMLSELATASLPIDSVEKIDGYAQDIILTLRRTHVNEEISRLKMRLSRLQESDPEYASVLSNLVEFENRRRSLDISNT